jgi:hypothetical protein
MKKHFVLTHMAKDKFGVDVFYQGEYEIDQFPVRVSYLKDDYLIVPSWFSTKDEADEYIKKVRKHTCADFYLVVELHYNKNDPRIADAKIIRPVLKMKYYPPPSCEELYEFRGGPVIEVWRMWFMGRELAEQYVTAFNADVANAKSKGRST